MCGCWGVCVRERDEIGVVMGHQTKYQELLVLSFCGVSICGVFV